MHGAGVASVLRDAAIMSAGHMEALAALKAMRVSELRSYRAGPKPVTLRIKPTKEPVKTKPKNGGRN